VVRAYVGLGSNLGDRAAYLWEAARRLNEIPGSQIARMSALYETEPVGPIAQGWFLNAVTAVDTGVPPIELLHALKAIEREMGRIPSERWGPRLIDLDLLLYGDEHVETAELIVPHPELWNRRFVLIPLLDVVPAGGLHAQLDSRMRSLEASEEVRRHTQQEPSEAPSVVPAADNQI